MKEGGRRPVRSLEVLVDLPKTAELSYPEAAILLGMSKRTLYNLVSRGHGPAITEAPGKGVYFIKADLEAWDKSRKKTRRAYS